MLDIKSVLVIDLAVEDRIFRISQTAHDDFVDRYKLRPDGKTGLNTSDFCAMGRELSRWQPRYALGGSGGTLARTLKGLLPAIDVHFLSAIGGTPYGIEMKSLFRKAGVLFQQPQDPNYSLSAHHAVTLVLLPEIGGRTYATYPGNFGRVLRGEPYFCTNLIRKCDVIHLLGTNREDERLGWSYVDNILKLRWEHNKILWLNLPTHKNFAHANAGHFQYLIPSAHVVLGNTDELKWTYGTEDMNEALADLQQSLAQSVLAKEGRLLPGQEPVAFITDDKRAAWVVTATSCIAVLPKMVASSQIVSNGGAGDNALAGFLAGLIKGLPYDIAAQIGHALAAQKLRQLAPCLDDVKKALQEEDRRLAEAMFGNVVIFPKRAPTPPAHAVDRAWRRNMERAAAE